MKKSFTRTASMANRFAQQRIRSISLERNSGRDGSTNHSLRCGNRLHLDN